MNLLGKRVHLLGEAFDLPEYSLGFIAEEFYEEDGVTLMRRVIFDTGEEICLNVTAFFKFLGVIS